MCSLYGTIINFNFWKFFKGFAWNIFTKRSKIPLILSLINKVRVARDRREHSSDDHSEPSGKTGSTPSIGQRTSSGGAKSLKSLKSMRSYVQSATGEIYPPNMRIRGVSLTITYEFIISHFY